MSWRAGEGVPDLVDGGEARFLQLRTDEMDNTVETDAGHYVNE